MVEILSRPAASNNWASREYYAGRRERKVGAILHYMVGYLPGTTSMFQNPATGYSTSLGLGTSDGKIGSPLQVHRYVPADGYAYGSFNEYADRRGESLELQNPYPDAAGKPTPEIHDLAAQLLAQLCVEEDWPLIGGRRQLVLGDFPDHRFYQRTIPGFGVDFNITTHRSMALKDCPGPTDVQWIVNRGNEYLAGAAFTTRKTGDTEMRYFYAPGRGGFTDTTNDGPLYPATAEEAEALSFAYSGVDVSDRTWDVLRQASLNRQDASGKARDHSINAAIDAAIDEAIGDGDVEVTINTQEIAEAVRAEFGKNPIR